MEPIQTKLQCDCEYGCRFASSPSASHSGLSVFIEPPEVEYFWGNYYLAHSWGHILQEGDLFAVRQLGKIKWIVSTLDDHKYRFVALFLIIGYSMS